MRERGGRRWKKERGERWRREEGGKKGGRKEDRYMDSSRPCWTAGPLGHILLLCKIIVCNTTYTQSMNTIYSARLFTLGCTSDKPGSISAFTFIGSTSNSYSLLPCTAALKQWFDPNWLYRFFVFGPDSLAVVLTTLLTWAEMMRRGMGPFIC